MKTIKTMSIIGIIWFSLMFLAIAGSEGNYELVLEEAIMAILYGLAFAIVSLINANKNLKN